MATKVEIISFAFTNLGRGPISDIDNSAPPEVIDASKKYEILLEDTLGAHPWRFATFTRNLNKLTAVPPVESFSTAFQLPADYLNLEQTRPKTRFRIYENKIYANQEELQIDYRAKVTESEFPPWFTLYMVYILTENMAMEITQQMSIQQKWEKTAARKFIQARYNDSQQQTGDVIVNDDIFLSHLGSNTRGRAR